MKQFLRHIFLFLALFVVTANALAQQPVYKEVNGVGTWYSLYDEAEYKNKDKTFSVFSPTTKSLSFQWKKTGWFISYPIYNLDISESSDGGSNYTKVDRIESGTGTKQDSYVSFTTSVSENITNLKFKLDGGSLDRFYKDVKVPLAKHILLADGTYGTTSKSIPFGEVTIDGTSNAQEVKLRSFLTTGNIKISVTEGDKNVFRIRNSTNTNGDVYAVGANACAASGGTDNASGSHLGNIENYTVTIYFCPSEAKDYSGTITLTDGTSSATISVSGKGLKKNQSIVWSEKFAADKPSIPVGKEVSDAATAFSGLTPIIYSSSDTSIIAITNDGKSFKALAPGTATITASQTGDSKWNSTSSLKTITVTEKKIQYIKWTDNLTRFKTGDAPFTMTATAHILVNVETEETQEVPERTALIKYTSANSNIVSVNGKVLTIVGAGETYVTATLEGDDTYEKAEITMPVRVRNVTDGCERFVLDAPDEDKYSADTWGEYEVEEEISGPAGKLTFEAKKQYVLGVPGIQNVRVQQYVNGGWSTIKEIDPGKNYTSYGPYDLDRNAKKIRFCTQNGSYYRYFKNILVTQATYVEPFVGGVQLVNGDVFVLNETAVTAQSQKTFELNWSTCADGIYLESDDESKFIVQPQYISAESINHGKTTISVTCVDVNEPNTIITGNIKITYDGNKTYTLPVSCFVQDRFETWLEKQGTNEYLEPGELVEDAFLLKDKNGVVMGARIELNSSNPDIISIENIDGVDKLRVHCGGEVTLSAVFAGSTTHKPCSLSDVNVTTAYCGREMTWTQNYLNFVTDENFNIDETRTLNATVSPTGKIDYELHTSSDTPFAEIIENEGVYSLHVFGIGSGFITATVGECEYDGQWFESASMAKELRVGKPGACSPNSLEIFAEQNVYQYGEDTRIHTLLGLPAATMIFGAHAMSLSSGNKLKISFSKELEGDSWEGEYVQTVVAGENYNWDYSCPVLAEAKRVRFQAEASLVIYYNMVTIPMQTYLRASDDRLDIDVTVNVPFERTIKVDYSNVQVIQYEVSNTNGLGLTLIPDRDVDNGCSDYGSYVFTLRGVVPYPLIDAEETIVFHTTSGERVEIPVVISASLSDEYVLVNAGTWNDINNWQVNGTVPTQLPSASNPVSISAAVTIGDNVKPYEAAAYSVDINEGGSIEIMSQGGLTVHAGGVNGASDANLTIHNNFDGAGYVRISPLFTSKFGGILPTAKVLFTTRGQLNGGGLSADWQYIASPGYNVGVDILGSTVLYLRSEQEGWVRLKTFWAELDEFAGYALTQKAQANFTMYPQLINNNATIQLTYTPEGMQGDNLWGNSYMAPIDITKIKDEDFTGNVDKVFYLYNSGSWNDWNDNQASISDAADKTPGRYIAIPVGSASRLDNTKDQTIVSPMQGVYMKAKDGGGSITLNYEKHVWKNTQLAQMNNPLRIAGRKESAEEQIPDFQRVRLQVTSENSGADRMYIIQDSLTTSGYDNGYDAPKQMADNLMNIYTNEPFGKMEISSTNNMDGMYIGFKAGDDSEYTMTFTSLIGDSLYLYDSEMDTYVEMIELGQYQFSAIPQSTNDMRFQLLVAPELPSDLPEQGGGVTTGTEDITSTRLWINDRTIYVANAQPNSVLSIYTVSGMLVTAPYTLHSTQSTVNIADLPAGVYIIRLNDLACKFVCK